MLHLYFSAVKLNVRQRRYCSVASCDNGLHPSRLCCKPINFHLHNFRMSWRAYGFHVMCFMLCFMLLNPCRGGQLIQIKVGQLACDTF